MSHLTAKSHAPSRSPRLILIIDDEPAVRLVLTILLQRLAYEVVTASDGTAALALLPQLKTPPTVVLQDFHLPDMDGLDLARQIRALLPAGQLVIMSGDDEDRLRARLEGVTVDGVLHKPFAGKELRAALSSLG